MNVSFACVFISALLIYASKIPVAVAMKKMPEGYDNKNGREQQARLQGWGRRALAAHQNGFESFPIFAAAVIVAHLQHADPGRSAWLSVTFVVSRLLYVTLYLANFDKLRSTVWAVGMMAIVLLFVWA